MTGTQRDITLRTGTQVILSMKLWSYVKEVVDVVI